MRIIAVTLVALLLGAPALAAPDRINANDDCYNELTPTGPGNSCLRFDAGAVPSSVSPTNRYVYLWLGALDCGVSPACVSLERPESKSIVTQQNAIFGVLYVDSNDVGGLQRYAKVIGGVARPADDVVLV